MTKRRRCMKNHKVTPTASTRVPILHVLWLGRRLNRENYQPSLVHKNGQFSRSITTHSQRCATSMMLKHGTLAKVPQGKSEGNGVGSVGSSGQCGQRHVDTEDAFWKTGLHCPKPHRQDEVYAGDKRWRPFVANRLCQCCEQYRGNHGVFEKQGSPQ